MHIFPSMLDFQLMHTYTVNTWEKKRNLIHVLTWRRGEKEIKKEINILLIFTNIFTNQMPCNSLRNELRWADMIEVYKYFRTLANKTIFSYSTFLCTYTFSQFSQFSDTNQIQQLSPYKPKQKSNHKTSIQAHVFWSGIAVHRKLKFWVKCFQELIIMIENGRWSGNFLTIEYDHNLSALNLSKLPHKEQSFISCIVLTTCLHSSLYSILTRNLS